MKDRCHWSDKILTSIFAIKAVCSDLFTLVMKGGILIEANIRGDKCAGDDSFVLNSSGCGFIYL
jgi:hypothetical protein